MHLTDDEFKDLNLSPGRQSLGTILRSKCYTISEIGMILLYTVLIVLYLVFDGDDIVTEG